MEKALPSCGAWALRGVGVGLVRALAPHSGVSTGAPALEEFLIAVLLVSSATRKNERGDDDGDGECLRKEFHRY